MADQFSSLVVSFHDQGGGLCSLDCYQSHFELLAKGEDQTRGRGKVNSIIGVEYLVKHAGTHTLVPSNLTNMYLEVRSG